MMINGYEKTVKSKKLDKDSSLKITKNEKAGRISVAFSSNDGKLVISKSFQDTYEGRKLMEEFSQSINSIEEIKNYFGIRG